MEVVVYSLENCAWCKKFVEYLISKNIPFTTKMITQGNNQQMISEIITRVNQRLEKISFPFVFVGDEWFTGYNIPRFEELYK